jgi:hypothetical protein
MALFPLSDVAGYPGLLFCAANPFRIALGGYFDNCQFNDPVPTHVSCLCARDADQVQRGYRSLVNTQCSSENITSLNSVFTNFCNSCGVNLATVRTANTDAFGRTTATATAMLRLIAAPLLASLP